MRGLFLWSSHFSLIGLVTTTYVSATGNPGRTLMNFLFISSSCCLQWILLVEVQGYHRHKIHFCDPTAITNKKCTHLIVHIIVHTYMQQWGKGELHWFSHDFYHELQFMTTNDSLTRLQLQAFTRHPSTCPNKIINKLAEPQGFFRGQQTRPPCSQKSQQL